MIRVDCLTRCELMSERFLLHRQQRGCDEAGTDYRMIGILDVLREIANQASEPLRLLGAAVYMSRKDSAGQSRGVPFDLSMPIRWAACRISAGGGRGRRDARCISVGSALDRSHDRRI